MLMMTTIMIIIITLEARDKNLLVAEFQKSTRHISKKCFALVDVQSLLPY